MIAIPKITVQNPACDPKDNPTLLQKAITLWDRKVGENITQWYSGTHIEQSHVQNEVLYLSTLSGKPLDDGTKINCNKYI